MAEAIHSSVRLRGLRRALAISPPAAHAIRFGVAASAAIWIGKVPGLVENNATWILITVLMVLQPTTGGFLLKGALRAVGSVVAAFTAILLFGLFAQDPPLLMAGLFLVQAIAAYGFTGPRFQYAWFVWAFTTAIVLGDAMAGRGAVETIAFQRATMVGIGILLVLLVDALFWPARAESSLRQSLASRAHQLGDALRRSVAASVDSQGGPSAAPEAGLLAKQLPLVAAVRTELGVSRATADGLEHVAMLLVTLASRARVVANPVALPPELAAESGGFAAALTELARRIEAALAEVAAALTASRVPTGFSDDLEQALLALEAALDRLTPGIGRSAALAGRVTDLWDLVAVLRTLEAALSSPGESSAGRYSLSLASLRPDPFRMKIALRGGVAVVAAFLVPMALGWQTNTVVAPMAFMTAALTRGAGVLLLASLPGFLALGWLVADLLTVYVTPHVGRAPLALLVPFALAAAFAYIAAKRPKLAMLPSITGLIAFLSVFGGTGAPTDVYGPYNTVCYMAPALGVGWLLSRLMWPATAAGLFRQRVAVQLERCLEAVHGARDSGDTERGRRAADLTRACAAQAVQLGPLHEQARHEPVERALDQSRRAEILALATDLVDAVLGDRPGVAEPLLKRGGAPLRPLLEALRRAEEALLDSMQAAVDVMRGDTAHRASGLAAAQQAVEVRLEHLRADPGVIPELSADEKRRLLVELDSRRRLVFRQRAIEDWLAAWRTAEETQA